MTAKTRTRHRLRCPNCRSPLQRIERLDYHRFVQPEARRYQCKASACGWSGLIDKPAASARSADPSPTWARQWRGRTGIALVIAGVSLAAAGFVVRQAYSTPPMADAPRSAEGRLIPAGESYDGIPLPAQHPLALRVAGSNPTTPDAAAAAADAGGPGAEGLSIRRSCVWGQPGRNPYKGTVEQALKTANLPAEVVRQFAAKVKARDLTDRLLITNASIRAQRNQVEFDPRKIAMTYGRTLCLQTRVHFVSGHEEQADLYEVTDAAGKRYSVMVPDVCGNVSVLSEKGVERGGRLVSVQDEQPESVKLLFASFEEGGGMRNAAFAQDNTVDEPGTLLSVLGGLALMAWWGRRRRRP